MIYIWLVLKLEISYNRVSYNKILKDFWFLKIIFLHGEMFDFP
jgi:hypothetical protein